MGGMIIEKFLNQAVQAYGSEAAGVSETVATGISALTDPRGIAAAADAYEGYFPQVENANKATLSGLSAEGAFPSPSEFFQNVTSSEEVSIFPANVAEKFLAAIGEALKGLGTTTLHFDLDQSGQVVPYDAFFSSLRNKEVLCLIF